MPENRSSLVSERISSARKGLNPAVVTKMRSGWVVLGDNQTIPGYCLLLADPVAGDLNGLNMEERKQFLADMTIIGDALMNILNVTVINYSLLGNADKGLHAHIHPRYDSEKEEYRKFPPWKYTFMNVPVVEFDIEKNKLFMQRLKDEIERISVTAYGPDKLK